jgi:fibronectin type 3 domain-containing protein
MYGLLAPTFGDAMRFAKTLCALSALFLLSCGTTAGTVTVAIAPQVVNLGTGGQAQFSASVSGNSNITVVWSVQEGANGGTITQGGAYTAPGSAGTYHVLASSQADPSRGGSATVVVSASQVVSITLDAQSAELLEGGTRQFTATVTNAAQTSVSWVVIEGNAGGTVSSTGLYTAPHAAGMFHVVATANADTSKSVTALVTVDAPAPVVAIAIDPASSSVAALGQEQLSARITGNANTAATWAVEETAGGSITSSGLYTAPNAAGTFHVLATSVADPTKTAEASINVGAPAVISVAISPFSASIAAGSTQQYIASVTNSTNTAVEWKVQETGAGTISADGLYTAPLQGGTFHIQVTSAADPTKSAVASVTVAPPLAVTVVVTPGTPTLPADAQLQLSAAVSNAATSTVIWSVDEITGGSITTGGLYTAPHTAGTFHARATSTANTSVFNEAVITVSAPSAVTIAVIPATTTIQAGTQKTFDVSVLNATTSAVTWSLDEGTAGGSLSTSGVYTAPVSSLGGTFHVRATSVADNSKSAASVVTVTPPPALGVSVTPASPTIAADSQQQLSATVTNASSTSVSWSVDELGGGSVTTVGLYTAPHAAGTFHVRATSTSDNTKYAEAAITVLAPPSIAVTLSPSTASLAADAQQQVTATVTNAGSNNAVTWSIDESAAGTVTTLGLYTAPHASGTFHVRATSVADTSKFAEAVMTVAAPAPVAVTVNPSVVYLQTSTGWQFGASVTSAADTSVTWSVVGTGAGSITSPGGYYTAPATAGQYTVKATSNADPTKSAAATAVVSTTPPNVVVTVSAASPFVATHGTTLLTATVTGTSNNAVTWSLPGGSSTGAVDANGNYTAPAAAGTYSIRATSVASGSSSATVNVRVDAITVTVAPTTFTLAQGASKAFTSAVTIGSGDPLSTSVTWSVKESGGGSITSAGVYTTGATSPFTATVIATSVADPAVSASAIVTVNAPIAAPPTNLIATPGNHFVNLKWTAAPGAVTYNIYFAQHGQIASASIAELPGAPNGTTTGAIIGGLDNGAAYDFVITSVNTGGESGDSLVATATPFDGSAPLLYGVYPAPNAVAVPLTAMPYIEFTKTMNPASLGASFTLKKGATSVQGSVQFDGLRAVFVPAIALDARATYTATVTTAAQDAEGNAFGGYSWAFNTQSESTDVVHVLLGDTALTLYWDAVPGATYYTVYRAGVSGGPYSALHGTLGLSFTDINLANGTNYYYIVTANTPDGEGAPAVEVSGSPSAVLPVATNQLFAQPGNGQVILNWGNAGPNLTYSILRSAASGGPYVNLTTSGNSLGYVDTTVTNGTPYYYVVRSIDTHQNSSANSQEATATPSAAIIPAPANVTAVNGNNYVALTWGPVANAAGYVVLRTTTYGGPYSVLYGIGGNTLAYTDINASNNVTYFYVIAAVDSKGTIGTYSNWVEGDPATYGQTQAPTLSVLSAYNGRVQLTWSYPPGVTTFSLKRTVGGASTTIYSGGGQAYNDTNLANGTSYSYAVTAINQSYSATSSSVTATPVAAAVAAPTNLIAQAGPGTVSLYWTPVIGATNYTVSYGINPGTYTTGSQATSTTPMLVFNNLANSSPFYFVVTANVTDPNGSQQAAGPASNQASATPMAVNLPAQPVNAGSFAAAGVNNVFWNAVAVAGNPNTNPVTYNVWRTTGLGVPWTALTTASGSPSPINATSYIDTAVTNGQGYWYAVEPVLNGAPGPWSAPFQLTPLAVYPAPPAPASIVIHPGNNAATLTWGPVPGADYYFVYTSSAKGGPYQLYSYTNDATPSYTLPISNATPTYMVVRTHLPTSGFLSADSAEQVVTTSSSYPVAPALRDYVGSNQIQIFWSSVALANGYNVYRTTRGNAWVKLNSSPLPNTQTSYIDNAVVNDVNYYYAVAAVGTAGESVWSAVLSDIAHVRQPLPPPATPTVHTGDAAATLTWPAVPGASYYGVYTAAISGGPYALYDYAYYNAYTLASLGNGTPLYVVITSREQSAQLVSGYSAQATVIPVAGTLKQPAFSTVLAEREGAFVSWQNLANATGYHLYRALYNGNATTAQAWSLIATPATNTFQDTGVNDQSTYTYAVAGVNGSEGPWTFYYSPVSPNDLEPLPPGNITALAGNNNVTLTWDAVTGATRYYIYYSATPGGPYNPYTYADNNPAYTIPGTNGTPAYFVVTTYNGTLNGGYSQEVSATPSANLATTPGASATKVTGGIKVTWNAPTGAAGYLVYRFTPGAARWSLLTQTQALTLTDTTVVSGVNYQYAVAPTNGSGVGAWSYPTAVLTY